MQTLRSIEEVIEAKNELMYIVLYARIKIKKQNIEDGYIKLEDLEIPEWTKSLSLARDIEEMYDKDMFVDINMFECGFLHGSLIALMWCLEDHSDIPDV